MTRHQTLFNYICDRTLLSCFLFVLFLGIESCGEPNLADSFRAFERKQQTKKSVYAEKESSLGFSVHTDNLSLYTWI